MSIALNNIELYFIVSDFDTPFLDLPIVSISLSITGGKEMLFLHISCIVFISYTGVIFVCIILVTVSVILVFCVQHKPKTMTVIKSTNVCLY